MKSFRYSPAKGKNTDRNLFVSSLCLKVFISGKITKIGREIMGNKLFELAAMGCHFLGEKVNTVFFVVEAVSRISTSDVVKMKFVGPSRASQNQGKEQERDFFSNSSHSQA